MRRRSFLFVALNLISLSIFAQEADFSTSEAQMRSAVRGMLRFLDDPTSASDYFTCQINGSTTTEVADIAGLCQIGRNGNSASTVEDREDAFWNACRPFRTHGRLGALEIGQQNYMDTAETQRTAMNTSLLDNVFREFTQTPTATSATERRDEFASSLTRLSGHDPASGISLFRHRLSCMEPVRLNRDLMNGNIGSGEARYEDCSWGIAAATISDNPPNRFDMAHDTLGNFRALDATHGGSRLNSCYLRACPTQSGPCVGEVSLANAGAALTGHATTCSSGISPALGLAGELEASIQWANNNTSHPCVILCRGLNRTSSEFTGGTAGNLYSDDNLNEVREIRDELLADFTSTINSLNLPQSTRDMMIRKLNRIDIGRPDASNEDWHGGLNGYCREMAGHGHDAESSTIILSPAYMAMLQNTNGRALVMRTLAHEMGHAIDRMEDGTGDSSWNSAHEPLNSCITNNWNISSYSAGSANRHSLLRESFADNLSMMVMDRRYGDDIFMGDASSPRTVRERNALIANVCSRAAHMTAEYLPRNDHPISVDRATHYLMMPNARRLLGCDDTTLGVPSSGVCNGH